MEYLGGSKRWSRNDSDIVPWKSSIGLISSRISSRPDLVLTSTRPLARAASTRAFHLSLPSSQSTLSVCRARRLGTSRGSRILAKEIRRGAVLLSGWALSEWFAATGSAATVREAAKRGPSEARTAATAARACRTTQDDPEAGRHGSEGSAKRQHTHEVRHLSNGPPRTDRRISPGALASAPKE
jgi:hypothetical protein